MENQNNQLSDDIVYVTLEGGEDTIEGIEKTIEMEKKKVEKAKIIQTMVEDGSFHKLFSLESRRAEIALATSHLINPLSKNRMLDVLTFHSQVEAYFGSLIAEGHMAEATITELESLIQTKM